ncbi:MAG: NAD(P)-binding domain-containing protein, partial [Thiogranum sp.]|nr:NAD(P)-binding domain-containing protein [Thiogranum sp.]
MDSPITPSHIAVLGAGSWGTALAMLLARNGHEVKLWDRDSEHVEALNRQRENRRHLPGISLPDGVTAFAHLNAALEGSEFVVVVVPSAGFREV